MAQRRKGSPLQGIDTERLQRELSDVGRIADRVRIAQFGLTRPLVTMREAQLRKEAARTARRKGTTHPETRARAAAASRMAARVAAYERDLARVLVDPPVMTTEAGAGLYGRVVDAREPVAEVSVVVLQNGERSGFTCTDQAGRFALEIPAGDGLVVSIRTKDGAEPYRDRAPFALQDGQQLYREIDLAAPGGAPCPEPPDAPEPAAETVPVPELVGLDPEAAAQALEAAGLRLGQRRERPTRERVGTVVAQSPAAGTQVRPGSAVAVTVGIETVRTIPVPGVVGLPLERAGAVLDEAGLTVGEVAEKEGRVEDVGNVVRQDPAPPAEAAPGTAVDLRIGREVDRPDDARVGVPNVVGRTLDEAAALIDRAGLEVGEVTPVASDDEREGRVTAQDPAANRAVAPGTAVALEVARARRQPDRAGVLVAAERAETELREREVVLEQPQGFLASRLADAEVRDAADLDALLARDRRELRAVLGLRTLAQTDRAIAALKRARAELEN